MIPSVSVVVDDVAIVASAVAVVVVLASISFPHFILFYLSSPGVQDSTNRRIPDNWQLHGSRQEELPSPDSSHHGFWFPSSPG